MAESRCNNCKRSRPHYKFRLCKECYDKEFEYSPPNLPGIKKVAGSKPA